MSDEIKVLSEQETNELLAKFDRESNVRRFTGVRKYIITGLLVLFAVYVFWVTLFANLPEQIRRSAFVGILVFTGFLLFPVRRKMTKRENYIPWYDFVLGILGAAAFFYYVINFRAIVIRNVMLLPIDVFMGVMGILILIELCRRVVGLPILVVASCFIIYAFIDGLSYGTPFYNVLRRIVHQLFYTTDGIIGTPIGVCSTFIVLFIFLASFLEKSGIADFFIEIANSVVGFASGGPAKVAVVTSAFEGMVSGSSVANTVGSGSVTIPTMKKTGYKPEFAAAVEAAASTGGQIMPPIMGAAAFLMAEMTGIPYTMIAISAIIPAILYFTGIFLAVHFEARKLGLRGLPKEEMPRFGRLILRKGYLLLPIFVLIFFMGRGFTPAYSACFAILAAFIVSIIRKDTRFTPATLVETISNGTRNTIGVAIACAVAGTIVGIVTLTGIGQMLIGSLISIVNNPFLISTGTSLFIALFFTMIACLILGMGVPTTANYVIMATITAPMVLRAGAEIGVIVPVLAAHMFVFYFGIVADITPPVALAAYAGAAIAKSDPMKTAITTTRLAIAAFIVPYVFIFNPSMLIIDATLPLAVQAVLSTFLGMVGIASGLSGYMLKVMSAPLRIAAVIGGLLLISASLFSDITGLAIITVLAAIQLIQRRKEKQAG